MRDPGASHGPALSAGLVRRLAAALAPLHAPAIGIPLSAAALALHLLALRSLPALLARERMLLDPAWLVAIALLLPVLLIHELGHASALAYRGGAPGRVGIRRRGPGVVFYADVSDAARLARAGRIGVDLGGLHLQWLACGVLAALHLATGHTLWLEALLVADLNLILNLSPAPGSDGHWLLCDALQTPALGPRALAMLARPRRGSPLPPVRWRLAMLYFVAMALHLALLAAFALGWLLPRLAREWSARR